MIDLNNTWCEATIKNYNALIKLGLNGTRTYGYEVRYFIKDGCFDIFDIGSIFDKQIKGKQIHLINGEFQYVETKPKNNFKDYGFEADFEGEILKKIDNMYIGYYLNKKNCPISCTWWDGLCSVGTDYEEKYDLKPIKKEWYENHDNFPCLLIDDSKEPTDQNKFWYCPSVGIAEQAILFGNLRPATKEEVLALLVKE